MSTDSRALSVSAGIIGLFVVGVLVKAVSPTSAVLKVFVPFVIGGAFALMAGGASILKPLTILGITSRATGLLIGFVGLVTFSAGLALLPEDAPEPPTVGATSGNQGQKDVVTTVVEQKSPKKDLMFLGSKAERRDKRLRSLAEEGAELARQNRECLELEYAAVDPEVSRPGHSAFYYNCRVKATAPSDRANLFLTGDEIKSGVIPQFPKPIPESTAWDWCVEYVRRQATFPSSVDVSVWHSSQETIRYPYGNVRINLAFTAKNALGAELPYMARCIITPAGKIEVNISPR